MFKLLMLVFLVPAINCFSMNIDPECQPLRSTPSLNLDSPVYFESKSVFRTRTSTAPVAPVKTITTNHSLEQAYELDRKLKNRALRYTCCSCITGLIVGLIPYYARAK